MIKNTNVVPPLASWLLERLVPAEHREALLGDLEECFHREISGGAAAGAARRRYWIEALRAPITLALRASAQPSPARGDGSVTSLFADIRHAFRLLGRRPAFTALSTLTLALGIGATTAIFSAVYPILFAPLPYPHPDRLVMVWEREKDGGQDNLGYATYRDMADGSTAFASSAAMSMWQAVMTTRTEPERLSGQRVSYTFFKTLGVQPAIGRDFHADEDVRGTPRVVILSNGLWRSRFGGDSSVVGSQVTLDGNTYTVLGVMPAGFESLLDPTAQMWSPLRYDVSLPYACRTCHHLRVVARLKPGVSATQANRELDVISAHLVAQYPTEYTTPGMDVPTLHAELTKDVRPALLAVAAAVAILLLIACANVTNLLLARAALRRGEFAVRAALGAGSGRLIRQLLTESTMLALVGGTAGILVAVGGVKLLVALSPPQLPRLDQITVNAPVLLFALAVTTIVGFAFGLGPALAATRRDTHEGIKQGSRRNAGTGKVLRATLVISEVALALVLLTGSGLLLRSMTKLFSVSPGFDPSHMLTLQVQTGGGRINNDTVTRAFNEQALQAIRALPGVRAAAYTSQLPLSTDFDKYGVHSQSKPRTNPEDDPSAHRYAVSTGYLEAMKIPLLRGRTITNRDGTGQPPVVILGESFAKRLFGTDNPIGQHVRIGDPANGPWWEVIGIAGDVKQVSLSADRPDGMYIPELQWQNADGALSFVIRTAGDPTTLLPTVQKAVWALDKDQPIVRASSMDHLVAASAAQRTFTLVLFGAFAAVALVLAAAGIYGVLSGTVTERIREIGVRSALGASRRNILTMIVRQGLSLTGIGVLLGLGASVLLGRLLNPLLFQVSGRDFLTYGAVTLMMVAVALCACWFPASRAARVDPMETLRSD